MPTLTDSRLARRVTLCALYAAQGMPWGFVTVTLLAYLAERIVDPENPDEMIVGSSPLLDKLINVAENTRTRMETTKYAHTAKLCVSLLEVANNIRDAGDDPASKDLNLLNPVANAIKVGFEDVGSANAAEEIADTMTKWD